MILKLYRYVSEVKPHQLPDLLSQPDSLEVVPLGLTVDLTDTLAAIEDMPTTTTQERAALDRLLVEPFHQALHVLHRREALDMRFWHWLCINALPQIVWCRWLGRVPDASEIHAILEGQRSLAKRFLGSASLSGVNRNTFARVYWCAEHLSKEGTDYTLASQLLGSQDLLQAVFDRQFSLYPPAARAVVRLCVNRGEDVQRQAIRNLNHLLTTVLVEALDEDEVAELLTGYLVAAK